MARRGKKGPKKKSKNMPAGTSPGANRQQAAISAPATDTVAPLKQEQSEIKESSHQSLGQKRAQHALAKINGIGNDNENYLAYVKALPATIIMSGLGQALAMEKAGSKKDGAVGKGHEKLFSHMNEWLCIKWEGKSATNILDAINSGTEDHYIRSQAEAMEYLEWLKKFAVAFLDDKNDSSNHEAGEP